MSFAIIISICSAIVSVAGFIFNVYQFRDKKGSVRIVHYASWEQDEHYLSNIEFSVINITERKKIIKYFIFYVHNRKSITIMKLNESIIEIEANQKFDFKMDSNSLYPFPVQENSYIVVTLEDIIGNKYHSQRIYYQSPNHRLRKKIRFTKYLPFGLNQLFDLGIKFGKGMLMSIYPNPVFDELIVQIENDKQLQLQVQIVSLSGHILSSTDWNTNAGTSLKTLNVSSLKSGNYFVKVITTNGEEKASMNFQKL